ncbi:50S ribosomal protein L32 [bacterium (Candidatus Moisslbacteria) CG12_big_fil_rev_8_21_14_0_65_36_11]|nr:MAG: 50S ribosomal protein L32 [bacterium (Candidatus Moisslbacteria) CG12_big_fil_rev_8_21_14_0_65_36_11]PJC00744.1 MAG: 50S ribosomal protein L32 [bacterium (Candidatus Moisslbacteria) CG_4_9_14_0_8_um_filter_36_20]
MALPTQKRSTSRQRRRASLREIKPKTLFVCSQCKKEILPHRVCPYCGCYKNKPVIKMKEKK